MNFCVSLEDRKHPKSIACIDLPNPAAREGCDTRVIFKGSLTGLNLEFSFSMTSCHTKAKELSFPYYLTIGGGRISWIHTFSKGNSAM